MLLILILFRLCLSNQSNTCYGDSLVELKIDFPEGNQIQESSHFIFWKKHSLKIKTILKNNCGKRIRVEPLFRDATLRFLVFDSNQRLVNRNASYYNPHVDSNYFKWLSPNEELVEIEDLFDEHEYGIEADQSYTVKATYHTFSDRRDSTIFTGNLESNMLVMKN